ncbi:MmcQ/YjbR family DNA-binding protein [Janibacter anophelis]|uniref:MmcQ/YjbR family DNA-binding protein n=1 Tax=Janibacter anophelis TaxID=319054 RepID=UPI003F7E95AC
MTPGEQIRDHALSLPGAWPDEPWEGDLVAKVGPEDKGKMFAFLGDTSVGVKAGASREEADEWLDRYPDDASVMAYIGRNGWNTLALDGAIPLEELLEAVEDSYDAIVAKLPKKARPPQE